MTAPDRLEADSEEIIIADRYAVLISIARDQAGNALEIVYKARDKAGKSGSDIELMFADLGIATSKMLQGRPATSAAGVDEVGV